MYQRVLVAVAIACFFYLVVPGLGAFQVRRGWRVFRRRIASAARMPLLERPATARPGSWRFLGTLEAVQGVGRVWLATGRGEGPAVAADLDGPVYILPWQSAEGPADLGDEEPQILSAKNIPTLPAGTQVLVAGAVVESEGQRVFRSAPGEPLLAVFFEGDARTLLERAVWCGRQRNEYWNNLTRTSLLTGFLALFLVASLMLPDASRRPAAMLAYALCVAPAAILLPPGVLFYFLYKKLWKSARLLRAERDLFRLPLVYFDESGRPAELPGGERYVMVKGDVSEIEARLGAARPAVWESSLSTRTGGELTLFGAEVNGKIVLPREPMAGLVLLPGDPEELARQASSAARRRELLAGVLFAAGFVPNAALLLYGLRTIIR
jgi:hypothetical protein